MTDSRLDTLPFVVEPISATVPFGAVVKGLTRSALDRETVRSALRDLWVEHGVVIFRDFVGEEEHLELSQCFGELMQHPVVEARAKRPELTTIRFDPGSTGWLLDVDGEQRGFWLPWHSDLIYVDKINHGGILRPVMVPSRLGQTGFMDKIAAYTSLPDALKERIDHLEVIYKYDLDPAHQKYGKTHDVRTIQFSSMIQSIQNRLGDFPRVVHPMVYSQPETGRKVLNLSPWFADGIVGMEDEEGEALLREVVRYSIDERNAYYHEWLPTDMVLWDNWRVLHCAAGSPADEVRWMERTTILGDYGLGRSETAQAVNAGDYISV